MVRVWWCCRWAFLGLVLVLTAGAGVVTTPAQAVLRTNPDGVLYFPSVAGLLPALHAPHYCSASVVDSPNHDLVVTAAHCIYGTGATIAFAPGFHNGTAPYGIWRVTRIYVNPQWISRQSPEADVAFLQIAPQGGRAVQDVVGARAIGMPRAGKPVTVSGFPASSPTPSVCSGTLFLTRGYPSVHCAGGMVDGVSGGAWVQWHRVVGVVGGLEQGGCAATIAYSSPFDRAAMRLFGRARAGGAGDIVPLGFFANSCS